MNIDLHQEGNWTILAVDGRVDGNTAPALEASIANQVDQGATHLLLGLSQTLYMSSAGLRVLLATLKKMRSLAGDLQLRDPQKNVREVLDISGFAELFTIQDTGTPG